MDERQETSGQKTTDSKIVINLQLQKIWPTYLIPPAVAITEVLLDVTKQKIHGSSNE